jgi:alpha-glucoside transport system permease protein
MNRKIASLVPRRVCHEESLVDSHGAVASTTVTISHLVNSYGGGWEHLRAAAFVSMLLPPVVFFSLQQYFVKGMLSGSVKG